MRRAYLQDGAKANWGHLGDKWPWRGPGSGPALTHGHGSSGYFTAEGTSYLVEGGKKRRGLPGSLSESMELRSF